MEAFASFQPKETPLADSFGKPAQLYVVTNEHESKRTYEDLRTKEVIGDTLITISGIQGLHQFASLDGRVKYCLHVDPNPAQKIFWGILLTSIQTHDNASSTIKEILSSYALHFGKDRNFYKLDAYFKTDHHLFSTDIGWVKVKEAVNEKRILSLSVNLGKEKEIDLFCSALQMSRLTVDTMYVSNLGDKKWLGGQSVLKLLTKIRKLHPHQRLNVIHAKAPFCICTPHLSQRVKVLSKEHPLLGGVPCRKELKHELTCITLAVNELFNWYVASVQKGIDLKHIKTSADDAYFRELTAEISSFDLAFAEDCKKIDTLIQQASIERKIARQFAQIREHFPGVIEEYKARSEPLITPICFAIGYRATQARADAKQRFI